MPYMNNYNLHYRISAIFTPTKASDGSESESENKRSKSKSPVKRAKANTKITKTKPKPTPPKKQATVIKERKCPVAGCDSVGHLSGLYEKHFTQDACPIYHNMALAFSKIWAVERKTRDDERKKAIILYDPIKKMPTVEQKAYQLKVKEIRTKFKPMLKSPARHIHAMHVDKEREPDLNGLVPDYDLQLFREAQAVASDRIETELKKLPPERGTK